MPRIDRRYDRILAVLADDGGGKGAQCGDAYNRLARGQRDAPRSRKATRNPVKLPGPAVATMRSNSVNATPDASTTRAIIGINASAWPRFISCDSCAMPLLAEVSRTAAAQASSAVSIARVSMAPA